jgi:Protein of unknown function (DUF3237)
MLGVNADSTAPPLDSEFAFLLHVTVGAPVVVGDTSHGLRRMVPITGGTIEGARICGRVLAGGADWQVVRPDGVLQLQASYLLETRDGVAIMVSNRGLRHASDAIMRKLARGEPVSPARYYFRTIAEFEAPGNSRYAWLNRSIFVGVAQRAPTTVTVRMYRIN